MRSDIPSSRHQLTSLSERQETEAVRCPLQNMLEVNFSTSVIPKQPTVVQVGNSIKEIPTLDRLVQRG